MVRTQESELSGLQVLGATINTTASVRPVDKDPLLVLELSLLLLVVEDKAEPPFRNSQRLYPLAPRGLGESKCL